MQNEWHDQLKAEFLRANPVSADKAIAKHSEDVNAHMGLAYRYFSQHDLTHAVAQLTEVQKLEPKNRKVAYTRGLALEESGNT